MWRYCCEIFDYLSLAAIVDDRVFCVHGGLSPSINTLDQVGRMNQRQLEKKEFILMAVDFDFALDCARRIFLGLDFCFLIDYRFERSIGSRKCRTMEQCVISCGLIPRVGFSTPNGKNETKD